MTTSPHPRPVVVGVDASEAALHAVAFAADEARRRGAPLSLVHALTWPFGGFSDANASPEVQSLVRAAAEEVLGAAAGGAGGGVEVTASLADGDPVHALREAAATAQLLVVGSRGAGGVTGLLVGSTAAGVVGHVACPVVVLPDPAAAVVRPRRSVVVGVRGAPDDDEVLDFAFAAAAARGTDLVAVHAWQDVVLETAYRSLSPLAEQAGVGGDAQRVLAEALAGWRDKEPGVPVREVVVRDRPARALVAAGATAELLVVGQRRRRWPGPTTHGVLHRATCPVAVVPLREEADR
ncbi:universal stress protein [Blastococcus sp. MG754426]|uniref:universal stress protein n=1 Tax=unclassified Blastococcus TaxID=2619396 RepID=UPI001EF038B0|nr:MULTISPECIES: universal stress protein [unclassified Blastococcus]MCF6507294.1 universal stress protein [Blastococcus sp. MG754426]MCF6510780.1 universal stress protein [Blastococcus sp. MG754427]MCF6734344.1 universal stress protein [Blastococcus sp. KM273129]